MLEQVDEISRGSASPSWGKYEGALATSFGRSYVPSTLLGTNAGASLTPQPTVRVLQQLPTHRLRDPLTVTIHPDGEGFTATVEDLPLYGHGDTAELAVDMLSHEIEALHQELNSGEAYAERWVEIRDRLNRLLA